MDDPLVGHVVLIVEPEIDPFGANLQAALEGRGAETVAVREPGKAFEAVRAFRFSAAVLNYNQASDALNTLINELSDVPILLYGGESASVASTRIGPHLAFTCASVDSITSGLGRLLRPGGE